MEPGSLLKDHIVINSIVISEPEITLETKITSSNLQDLLKNIQQSSDAGDTPPQPSGGESKPAQPGKEVKLEVKSFRLEKPAK